MPLGNSSFRTSFNIIVLQTCRPPRSSDRRRLAFCPPLPLPLLPRGLPQTADVRKRGVPWDAVCDRGSPSRTVSGNWLTGRTPSCVTDAPHTPPAARVTYGASKLDIEKKKKNTKNIEKVCCGCYHPETAVTSATTPRVVPSRPCRTNE